MYILGISCFYHDAAAALLEDGMLVAAAEEERFTRKKHDLGFPENSIRFCLDFANISAHDLDYVVFYEKPFVKFERILTSVFSTFPRSWKVFREAMVTWLLDKLWIKSIIQQKLKVEDEKILFCDHHLSHAASAFFCSPFDEAAIMTIDGVGEWTTATLGCGKGTEICLLREMRFPHSLGLLYSAFTAFLGFKVNSGEYKVMGMAPFGIPLYTDRICNHLIRISDDGSFSLNMDYFSYHYSPERTFTSKFESLFGKPRVSETPFFTKNSGYPSYFGEKPSSYEKLEKQNQYYADVAASIQYVTEEILLKMANFLYKETCKSHLCIAGGVALNSKANGRLLTETPFGDIYIQPSAGDGGGALGAALYAWHSLLGKPRKFIMEHAFWGKAYEGGEIKNFLDQKGVSYKYVHDDDKLIDYVVDALLKGNVVGWFQGRFEWGPRALGNRSILADPRKAEMKDIVNTKIKFREPFRPFAPVILEKRTGDYFHFSNPEYNYPARYMLLVLPLKDGKRDEIAAVNHMGTGRLQTLRKAWNPRYYEIARRFGEATGVPVLLNTSFNLRGEPIVNTPENAFNTFSQSGIDLLVMENFLVKK